MNKGEWPIDIREHSKLVASVLVTLLLDAVLLAVASFILWGLDQIRHTFPLYGIDSWWYGIVHFSFSFATGACVVLFVGTDLVRILLKVRKLFLDRGS